VRVARGDSGPSQAALGLLKRARALRRARAQVTGANVLFLHASAETLDVPGRSFDAAVFSLSLHHVPPGAVDASLLQAARQVLPGRRVVVIEPGDEGTLIDAEMRLDVGDLDGPRRARAEGGAGSVDR